MAAPTTWPRQAASMPRTAYQARRETRRPMSMKHAAALMTPTKPASTSHGGSGVRGAGEINDIAGVCLEAYASHCRVVNGGSVRPLQRARSLLELGGWGATLATVAELLES